MKKTLVLKKLDGLEKINNLTDDNDKSLVSQLERLKQT